MKGVELCVVAVGLLCEMSSWVVAFNVIADARHVRTFNGPQRSYFGTTVLSHRSSNQFSILVGAPNSTSECQPDLPGPPGALFQCQPTQEGGSCNQVCLDNEGNQRYSFSGRDVEDKKDGQFLGMALTRQPGQDGKVVVCGHKWMNQDHATRYPNSISYLLLYARGICYEINAGLELSSVKKIRPCITERSGYWYNCLSGASADYAVDGQTLLLGAPGAMYNRGSVVTVAGDEIHHIPTIWNHYIDNHQYPYLGYSMSSGHFSSPSAVEGVTGAPRYRDIGAVYIFDVAQQTVVTQLFGERVNSYFGASVEAVDLNNDMWSDLLVGAPLYSTSRDEGCVYVYINDGLGNLEMRTKLRGSNAIGAKFGSAIETVGDLNKDDFTDIAIGAPYEDEMSGAVYIYHGASYGINHRYSQRIAGKSFDLISFGYSLAGSLDLDGNQYPDLIVGAHLNNSVVYLRTKPVVYMTATMELFPTTLIMRNTSSVNKRAIRSTVTLCLTYRGVSVGTSQNVVYTLEADSRVSSILQSRVYFGSAVSASTLELTTSLDNGVTKCVNHTLTVKNFVKDFLNPIPVELSYRLLNESSTAPVLSPSSRNGIQKEIGFGRDCGADDICQAELQFLNYSYSLRSDLEEIVLGADSSVFITVAIANEGEEAHQARLVVKLPEFVVFEAVQTISTTERIGVKCEPVSLEDGSSPFIDCNVGNPLSSNGQVILQIRMDIGNLAPRQTVLNVSLSLSTSSRELDSSNNDVLVSIPVTIQADVTVNGASTPEQLVYKQDKSNLPKYLKDILKTVGRLRDIRASPSSVDGTQVIDAGEEGQDRGAVYSTAPPAVLVTPKLDQELDVGDENSEVSVNDTAIGPKFTQQFEIANLGPGRVPYATMVNVSIPWRTRWGDWLIFITEVKGRDGVEGCNLESILKQQYQGILKHYNTSSKDRTDADSEMKSDKKKRGTLRTTFDCGTAECVTLQCRVQPLAARSSAVIEVHARLWKYSFLKSSYGLVEMISDTSLKVMNPEGLFTQPEGHLPDATTVKITVSAEEIQVTELPLPPWVIPFSAGLGALLLIMTVIVLKKLGFFRRKKMEDMKRQLMQEEANAAEQEDTLLEKDANKNDTKMMEP